VLLFRPEALAGPSFQMSFGAVTAIVALHSTAWARRLLQRRDEGIFMRIGRSLLGIVATGLAVELALMPMALFHFHRSGLYGVGANIIAIPLTTFVIMPLEAGALLFDAIGLGRPLWFLCGASINALLWLAHSVSATRGAVALLPSMQTCGLGDKRRGRPPAVDADLGLRADDDRIRVAVPVEYASEIARIASACRRRGRCGLIAVARLACDG